MTPITISAGNLTVTLMSWGAAITDVRLNGVEHSLTYSTNTLADLQGEWCHHGTLIGPIANRISNARIKLDGMMHELERNQDGRIHLHSGKHATHRQNWTLTDHTATSASFCLRLPDGMCGLPGNRVITATYRTTDDATLTLDITGTTDTDTAMNFANHSYWTLDNGPDWSGHHLRINADRYLPITDDHAPTGDILDVTGTPMDFRTGQSLTLGETAALDHNFCLSDTDQPLRDVLWFTGANGVAMTMATTACGMQIYDGGGAPDPFKAIACEAQGWPDAPNHRGFPPIKLRADDTYRQTTQWRFTR